jgi:hypothetical protein
MFQAQIHRELRGSSLPNIFPPQVERMHVVTCKRQRQDELAAQITTALTRSTPTAPPLMQSAKKSTNP